MRVAIKGQKAVSLDEAMLVGLKLNRLPTRTLSYVMTCARKYGWTDIHWCTRQNCRRLAKACRNVRDDLLTRGISEGVNECDRVMHMLCSALDIRPANL